MSKPMIVDLTGRRFGRLTVVGYAGASKWSCRCDCGKTVDVPGYNLRKGRTKSCGCLRTTDHTGEIFGQLTAVEKLPDGTYSCRCSCGNERVVRIDQLVDGTKTMCEQCAKRKHNAAMVAAVFANGTQPGKLKGNLTKANKSGVCGVNWDKSRGKWQASIKFQRHKYNLGRFDEFDDAVKARKEAEERIFGDFLEWYDSRKKDK